MWESLRKKFKTFEKDLLKEMLEKAGLSVKVVQESYTVSMTKGEWYSKIRGRIFSTLHSFSDEDIELEKGLEELDRNCFPNASDSDIVDIKDTLLFYSCTKKV